MNAANHRPEDLPGPTHDLRDVTEKLRLMRTTSLQQRYSGQPAPALPSRAEIMAILTDVIGVLYPRHHGPEDLRPDQVDPYVETMLPQIRDRLARQIALELMLDTSADPTLCRTRGAEAAARFMASLLRIRDLHDTDITAAYAGDPSAKSLDEVVFCFPGVLAVLRHRIAHEIFRLGATMIARVISEYSHSVTGIDIHPGAQIAAACFIDHGTGVVIGETAIIGRNVRLYQQVTLGAKRFEADEDGALVKGQPRHPVIGDDVVIYAGATILGRITIGQGSVIGGGVWLTNDVPPGSNVLQARPKLTTLRSTD